jgi:putative DNA primase/helicase
MIADTTIQPAQAAAQPLAPLIARAQWILVMLVPLPNGKTNKIPVDYRTGNPCDAHRADVWTDHATATALAARWGASFTVGFVLTAADPFWCVDLDSVRTPSGWSPAALQILSELPGTAVEVSQSGQGLHIWGQGEVPAHGMKRMVHGIKAEFYSALRFIAIGTAAVGDMSRPCPTVAAFAAQHFPQADPSALAIPDDGPCAEWRGPADDAELIRRAMQSRSARSAFGVSASFADLWTGDAQALGRAYPSDTNSSEPFDRSSADAALAQHLAFWTGRDVARIERLMRQSALVRPKWDDRDDYLVARTITGACGRQGDVLQDKPPETVAPREVGRPHVMLGAEDPLTTAREVIARNFTHCGQQGVRYWQGSFYRWTGAAWAEFPDADARAAVYAFIDEHGFAQFRPTARRVSDVMDALRAAANLEARFTPPCWIDGGDHPAATELVGCANGLLHLPTRTLHTVSPALFNLNATPFNFEPTAPTPLRWLEFLAAVWPNDPEAIGTLQEIFGYMLTPDTSQQKLFLIVGPKRSGKGTIARILTDMIGSENVAAPTLNGMGSQFGLASLVGKLAAIVSDARLGGRTDPKVVAENLLRVSGEDRVEIDRKNREPLTLKLGVRFLLLTNELPRIADASGAMASRFVVLTMSESFFGREDPGLTAKLLPELPGILSWAVEGWHRLRARGYFMPPKSSAEAVQDLADLGSPVSAFLRDECRVWPAGEVEVDELYGTWCRWCLSQGITSGGTKAMFGRDLKAALPTLQRSQPREGERRVWTYKGVGLARAGTSAKALQRLPAEVFGNYETRNT